MFASRDSSTPSLKEEDATGAGSSGSPSVNPNRRRPREEGEEDQTEWNSAQDAPKAKEARFDEPVHIKTEIEVQPSQSAQPVQASSSENHASIAQTLQPQLL